ncbi:MAG TPA: hypothetical protein V6D27_13910 [Vampirovibrionales bacterium]
MPNTVLQYRLPHSLPGIGGGDRGNAGGHGGKILELFEGIQVGILRAIACDRSSALGFLDPLGRSASISTPFPKFSLIPKD